MRGRATGVTIVLVGYAWWVTSLGSFRPWTYVAVAAPATVVALVLVARGPVTVRPAHARATAPWLVLFGVTVALEGVALALGGRSNDVATLSTTVDNVLVTHVGRMIAFILWFAAGAVPARRRLRPVDR